MASDPSRATPTLPRLAALLLGGLCLASAGCGDDALVPVPAQAVVGPLGDRADLPVDERLAIEGLSGPVDVVRDVDGRPHVYATSVDDALRVEGYFVAKDRTLQLEVLRRVAEGRMAELLGASDKTLIDLDITYRTIGLHRTAKAQLAAMPDGPSKSALEAYAGGITQYFRALRDRRARLPDGVFAIDVAAFTDWDAADTLAMARLQQHLLSYSADFDLSLQATFDGLRGSFTAASPDPLVAKRAGLERDLVRFAPADPATTTTGYPGALGKATPRQRPATVAAAPHPPIPARFLAAMEKIRALLAPEGFGSNDWAVSGSRTTSGRALLASDPHLSLVAPAVFWPVGIDVDVPDDDAERELHVSGVSFPGIPGVILGHDPHVAWGATVADYDVTDVYAETLTADGSAVVFQGASVPLQAIDEEIAIQGEAPYHYTVHVVPHHGPLLPDILPDHTVAPLDPAAGALSERWTGLEVTQDIEAILGLMRATSVDSALTALQSFSVGAQNWMLADTDGHIGWTTHALVPVRDPRSFAWDPATYTGQLPCLVLPGDGTAEWQGYLPDALVPWAKDPASGFLSTANNDILGDTLDNDPSNGSLPDGTPMYTNCTFDIGFRQGRIQSVLSDANGPMSPEDMGKLQGDVRSPMGARLVPRLLDAVEHLSSEHAQPGTHPDLASVAKDPTYDQAKLDAVVTLLTAWRDESGYAAEAGVDLDDDQPLAGDTPEGRAAAATMVFNAWLVRLLPRVFADELSHAGGVAPSRELRAKALLHLVEADPATLATYDAATGDSALWDDMATPEVESREERFGRALLDALAYLTESDPDVTHLRWGARHTVSFDAIVPVFTQLAIPPSDEGVFVSGFPRHGDAFNVDASDFDFPTSVEAKPRFSYADGPNQRFVAELDPAGVASWNAIPGGNVWDATSPHFRDQAELWRRNQTHRVPFLLDDVVAAKERRTVVTP